MAIESAIMQFFESIRCGFLNLFFAISTAFGEELVLTAMIAIIYWLVDKKLGKQMIMTMFTASVITSGLKGLVLRARPYVQDVVTRVDIDTPFVNTVELHPYESFPSGHATASTAFFGSLGLFFKKWWAKTLCFVAIALVLLSRLYLGVHFPTDVLCGLAVGFASVFLWRFIFNKFYDKAELIFLIFGLCCIPFMFFIVTESFYKVTASALACGIGLIIEKKFINFTTEIPIFKKIIRLIVGLVVLLIPYLLFNLIPLENAENAVVLTVKFIKYFVTILMATSIAPLLFKTFKI